MLKAGDICMVRATGGGHAGMVFRLTERSEQIPNAWATDPPIDATRGRGVVPEWMLRKLIVSTADDEMVRIAGPAPRAKRKGGDA